MPAVREARHRIQDRYATLTTAAALAARKATDSIPIVTVTGDPVESGLAASYARAGGNVTGLTHTPSDEWLGKLLALLKEAAPRTSGVAVIGNSANQPEARGARGVEGAARVLGLTLVPVEVRSPEDFEAAFAAIRGERADAIFAFDSALNFTHRQRIVDFAIRRRLPTVFGNRQFAEAGGLLSYSPSLAAQFRRAAYDADQILRGARPADLPIERPRRFELVVNIKTATVLGLAFPPAGLVQADEVIQ